MPLRNSLVPSRRQSRQLGPTYRDMAQTRRFFGGRHPLCGIGVTSRMDTTRSPTEASAWMADSRPLPGPCTRTCTRRRPRFIASRPQFSAATVAANGVRLLGALEPGLAGGAPRERVAPHVGDRDQQVVERGRDVGDALGLDDLLGALGARRLRWAGAGAVIYFFVTFFLPAMARRGPFLVRALVWVRCPRTGRPRRWRMPR